MRDYPYPGREEEHRTDPALGGPSRAEFDAGRNVGWLSVGLGITALAAPRSLLGLIGIRNDHRTLMRMIGLREIAAGIGILTQPRTDPWILSRVAGDFVDLALLGRAFASKTTDRKRLAASAAAVAGLTLLDINCARRFGRNGGEKIHHSAAITINRPRPEVYRFWRDLGNLPQFMRHLKSVQVIDATRSRWVAEGPGGMPVQWEAAITIDEPDERIAWRSLADAQVRNHGEVNFKDAPGGRGTEIHVRIAYAPPAGRLGSGLAALFGAEPGQQIRGDLFRFKQVMETGEVLHSDASIHRALHPARPPKRSKAAPRDYRPRHTGPQERL